MKNGSQIVGVSLGDELGYILTKRANSQDRYISDVILELVREGLEHERMCKPKDHHIKTK